MNANYVWHQGDDPISLADNLAGEVVVQLNNAIAEKGTAVIALSGGSTPKPLFEALVDCDVDWSRVVITLVDERWVDESHRLSNAAFLRKHLLDDLPKTVRFAPLHQDAESVIDSVDFVLNDYCQLTGSSPAQPRAFDVVILGMGLDGHTASFFPDANNVAELVDIDAKQALLTCQSPSTQVERITWSLPMLLNTTFLALHFTGDAKLAVFERAVNNVESEENALAVLPIRSAIFQDRTLLNVYYTD